MKLAGAITAGGRSKRFGTDKALFEFEGRSLLRRVADSLDDCEPKLLIAPPGKYDLGGWRLVDDTRPGEGPLAGLEAALAQVDDWLAFAGVDLPFVRPELWNVLARFTLGADLVVPLDEAGRRQPLSALYHASLLPRVTALLDGGERKLNELQQAARTVFVPWAHVSHLGPHLFVNLNTPSDLPRAP
ncbi:molybdenum cofactor guanylyltransferase [Deinococcus yavapaiensis]|uniref:Probable molybdenum cofactor guanylyltransferase n=1 Tax=Deinococcus yavapaiensis KR-236 TaxID=694435 RepID=A0A318SNT6_9DEIO|nr:molybdenum cofactor guanylyltransferase [Deinococcus yavapaiensis]PYE54410.1 molybdenum cofactor guanylyltransferase [Deinococcus yavapaiensis KR-236]